MFNQEKSICSNKPIPQPFLVRDMTLFLSLNRVNAKPHQSKFRSDPVQLGARLQNLTLQNTMTVRVHSVPYELTL